MMGTKEKPPERFIFPIITDAQIAADNYYRLMRKEPVWPNNQYGDIDTRKPLPDWLIHIPIPRAGRICNKLDIPWRRALMDFRRQGRDPAFLGIVVRAGDAVRLRDYIAAGGKGRRRLKKGGKAHAA